MLKDRSKCHFSTILWSFVALLSLSRLFVLNVRCTPRKLVEYKSLIKFRWISSRLHLLRRLSHLRVLLGLQCTKTVHLIASRMTKNVGAFSLSLSILHCRELFVRHAIQCPRYFRGVEEGENANCLITEHEHAQGNYNNN